MLLLKVPTTLNRPCLGGTTPLFASVMTGKENMVLHLLRLGAKQPKELDERTTSPLRATVEFGHVEILRFLLDQRVGIVGGTVPIVLAMESAMRHGRAKSLHVLLGHYFETDDTICQYIERWSQDGVPVLHFVVSFDRLATVRVLLASGADETARDNGGPCASEMIDYVV